jgi:hypothetical protein
MTKNDDDDEEDWEKGSITLGGRVTSAQTASITNRPPRRRYQDADNGTKFAPK